ncbi:HAUS augmin-like complex subunit 3 domain-containing protein [Phthorimaea operculella]|nr:HAUS augmin-like complex subunit 3 domain-containing protein [Phthorimaea operculella]
MSKHNEITDEEFVPFLHSLGVETYKKSFEWMLGDPTFAGVFCWLYNNLDQNNALTAREEYRYAELKKSGNLLSSEDLETSLSMIQQDFPGICLPGDQEGLEDVKYDITALKERLHVLEKEEKVLNNLIKQNEAVKDQLGIEVTKLNGAQQQYSDDETTTAAECLTLAEEVETLTEEVIDVIADALDMYANCHVEKDIAKKFLSFGPLEPYRQSQSLFRSHFNLYTTRKFNKRQNDSFSDEDLRSALVEASSLEDRLSDAALAYIESKADLCGEQAKLELASTYSNVHPSQIAAFSLEAQSAVELLVQEESVLEQQVQTAVKELANSRTRLAVDTATAAARDKREQINSDLTHLLSICSLALSCDRALYWLLRHELRALEESAQFAAQLRAHKQQESDAVGSRIESMKEITSSQEQAALNLRHSNALLSYLFSSLGRQREDDVTVLSRMYGDASDLTTASADVEQMYRGREQSLKQL